MWGYQTVPQRVGFHDGERLVQQRVGVTDVADRRAGMVAAPKLDGSIAAFVTDRDLVFLSSRDAGATLWTSVWGGVPGFCTIRDRTLRVAAMPPGGDVLAGLAAGALVGTLFVDFPRRRRVRVNGVVTGAGPSGLEIGVDQAYGNCPRYIHPRDVHPPAGAHPGTRRHATRLAPGGIPAVPRRSRRSCPAGLRAGGSGLDVRVPGGRRRDRPDGPGVARRRRHHRRPGMAAGGSDRNGGRDAPDRSG